MTQLFTDKNSAPWGSLDTNDKLDLAALKTDVALIRQENGEQTKKLDRIDDSVSKLPALIAEMRVGLHNVESRVGILENKSETIDSNKLEIARLHEKVTKLDMSIETMVIKAGPFRMRAVETILYTMILVGTFGGIWALLWSTIKIKLGLE